MIRAKRSLSQNFLNDFVARVVARSAGVKGKRILEIGPGKGALTAHLAKEAKHVTAVELDESLLPDLKSKTLGLKNVDIIVGDALAQDFSKYDAIVGAIPYHLSSHIVFKFVESKAPMAVFVVQKEFGERVFAEPGDQEFSRLSVMVQRACDASELLRVPRSAFTPVPKVDSIAILLERKAKPTALDADLVNALFQHKNKLVHASLRNAHSFFGGKDRAKAFAQSLDQSMLEKRVRELSLEDLNALSKSYAAFSRPPARVKKHPH